MTKMSRCLLPLSVCAMVLMTAPANAQKSDLTASQIVETVFSKGSLGFKQGSATVDMSIKKADGSQKDSTVSVKAMRNGDGLLRTMLTFEQPTKIAGMAFLVREKKDTFPDQFVYVPAAKVVRRIATGSANSSFFNSDFTFADLMPLPKSQMGKLDLKRLEDGELSGNKTYVVQVTPNVQGSPYKRLIAHGKQGEMVPLKIEFYDKKDTLLKVLTSLRLKKIGKDLVPVELQMKNVQKNTSTLLKLKSLRPDAKLTEAEFTEQAMQL